MRVSWCWSLAARALLWAQASPLWMWLVWVSGQLGEGEWAKGCTALGCL